MSDPEVRIERQGAIATLVLDNPAKRNAMTEAMWISLPGLIAQLEADAGVRVILLRGAGRDFSAGADIGEFAEVFATTERAKLYMGHFGRAQDAVAACAKPTLAVITGACVGGGCGLALACDLRFAENRARLGITPTKLGMIYTLADTRRLVEAVGYSAAQDLLFTGRLAPAPEALALGLVNRVFAEDRLDAEAQAYAAGLAAAAPRALGATKRMMALLRAGAGPDEAAARDLFFDALEGPEFAEGREAFLAGRAPDFG